MSTASSPRARWYSLHTSLVSDDSAPSSPPAASVASTRCPVAFITWIWQYAQDNRSRTHESSSRPSSRARSTRADHSFSYSRCWTAATAPRSLPSVVIADRQPLFSPPMTLNSGARAPSMYSWQKASSPDIVSSGLMVMPLSRMGTST